MAAEYLTYTTQDRDRWDLIAWKMYGDPYAYEGILRANPTVAAAPELAGAIALKVPILEVSDLQQEFAPWIG